MSAVGRSCEHLRDLAQELRQQLRVAIAQVERCVDMLVGSDPGRNDVARVDLDQRHVERFGKRSRLRARDGVSGEKSQTTAPRRAPRRTAGSSSAGVAVQQAEREFRARADRARPPASPSSMKSKCRRDAAPQRSQQAERDDHMRLGSPQAPAHAASPSCRSTRWSRLIQWITGPSPGAGR